MAIAITEPAERIEGNLNKCDVCESNMVNHIDFNSPEGEELVALVCNMCGATTERRV